MNESETLTAGQVADITGVQLWRLHRLIARGLIAEPRRIGHFRVFSRAELPAIRQAAEQAGYMRVPVPEMAGA